MIHCAAAVSRMMTAIFLKMTKIPAKSTRPASIIKSTACPIRIGRYSVIATVNAASTIDAPRYPQYLLMYRNTFPSVSFCPLLTTLPIITSNTLPGATGAYTPAAPAFFVSVFLNCES